MHTCVFSPRTCSAYVHMHLHLHVRLHVCMYVCMDVCMHAFCVFSPCTCTVGTDVQCACMCPLQCMGMRMHMPMYEPAPSAPHRPRSRRAPPWAGVASMTPASRELWSGDRRRRPPPCHSACHSRAAPVYAHAHACVSVRVRMRMHVHVPLGVPRGRHLRMHMHCTSLSWCIHECMHS